MAWFSYQPLPEDGSAFRILEIFPNTRTETVTCRLLQRQFPPQGDSYEALSYTWGEPIFDSEIQVDGIRVDVTKNLHAALLQFRLPDLSRFLWVDALCINQRDNKEKGQQVALMGDIYRKAARVLVWLGPEQNDSNSAIEFMRTIHATTEKIASPYRRKDLVGCSHRPCSHEHILSKLFVPNHAFSWHVVDCFCQRSWFERMWTFQELVLAKNVAFFCGDSSLELEPFTRMIDVVIHSFDEIAALTARHGYLKVGIGEVTRQGFGGPSKYHVDLITNREWDETKLGKIGFNGNHLHRLLEGGQRRLCADPRDKLYAVLGLMDDETRSVFPLNYTIPVVDLYRTVVEFDFRNKAYDILCFGGYDESDQMVPSWIPNWSRPSGTDVVGYNGENDFCASEGQEPAFSISSDGLTLRATGLSIGKIKDICLETQNSGHMPRIELLQEFSLDTEIEVSPGETKLEAIYQAATSEIAVCKSQAEESIPCPRGCIPFALNMEQDPPCPRDLHGYNNLRASLLGRQLIITDRGLLGNAPVSARIGDAIFILFGCTVPFVLREVQDNRFVLIGDCTIHGLMYGEVFKGGLDGQFASQEILLE